MTVQEELSHKETMEICVCMAILYLVSEGKRKTKEFKTLDRMIDMLEPQITRQRFDQALNWLEEGYILSTSAMVRTIRYARRIRKLERIFRRVKTAEDA